MPREKRVLVVDDDDPIRTLLVTVLHRRGVIVDTARNGEEAVDRLTSCRYSLMLLDLMMPRMNGYEVLERVREAPADNRPMVIVLTAGLEPRTFDTTFVVGTIHKPFDVELLVDTVTGCLSATEPVGQGENCRPDPSTERQIN